MSNVKLLNLDELAAVKRVVQIGGKEYPVAEQSIGQMIERLALSKKQDQELDDLDPEAFLKSMRQTAQDILPSAPKKVIDGLSIKMITRLVEFLNDQELDETAERMKEVGQENKYAEAGADHKTESSTDGKKS